MKIEVQRVMAAEQQTLGVLFVNGERLPGAWTLELPLVHAIPAGEYPAILYYSPHFGHNVIQLQHVPGHTAIEIHSGNTVADTKGCVLVGRLLDRLDFIYDSMDTLKQLLYEVKEGEAITVKISDCI